MNKSKAKQRPRYPSREQLATRVQASESVPDDAATALDAATFTTEMLAEWGAASAPRESESAALKAVAPQIAVPAIEPTSDAPIQDSEAKSAGKQRRAMWAALLAVAIIGGFLGALVGVWLALG